jgi:ATP/maltotriose-dependent transcriptional regulator MalT
MRAHIRAIYRKLGVSSRRDAVAKADALGLLDPPPKNL